MQHNALLAAPQSFNDSLTIRARNIRYRNIGSPFTFLDEVGLIPIKEFLFRGNNIIELADTLNLPLSYIHKWIDDNGFAAEIEEASVISAEGYIYRGQKALEDAFDKFTLDKARAMLEHGRFMAAKKDKKQYGTTAETGAGNGGVTYVFNMGNQTQTHSATPVHDNAEPIDAEYTEAASSPPPDAFSLAFSLPDLPPHIKEAVASIPKIEPTPDLASSSIADRWDY